MAEPHPADRAAPSLRGLVLSVVQLAQLRLELLSVDAREGALRLGELLLYGALAVLFLGLGLGFLAVLLTVLLWDSPCFAGRVCHRVLTLGGVAVWLMRARLREDVHWFSASREELQRDAEQLRP
jgi:uncharacterized membrane protein YqjE